MHKAAVVWCVLNRVDAEGWPDTVAEVVTQPHQFAGYSPDYPATEEFKAIAADVLIRWEREKREGVAVELADCMIRILDYCGHAGIDIEEAIRIKHEYNKTRPYRHGGKKC